MGKSRIIISFRFICTICFLALFFTCVSFSVKAQQPIGKITQLQGKISSTTNNVIQPLFEGDEVFETQIVRTGASSRAKIEFIDGSALTLGEDAEVILNNLVYDPATSLGQSLSIIKGIFRFTSGQIAKLKPRNVSVTTPVATIGIRGTEFTGGELPGAGAGTDSRYVIQINRGLISVQAAGEVVLLDTPGFATTISYQVSDVQSDQMGRMFVRASPSAPSTISPADANAFASALNF